MRTKGFGTKGLIILSILFAFVLLIFPMISAVEFDIDANYSSGQTMLTKVSGNFLIPITRDNVFFYSGHVRIPMDYDIATIQGDYYIYASLVGKTEGNYSISIENVKYMNGNSVVTGNLVRNFSITNETADFSVIPGFVSTSGDFYLDVQNLQDNQIVIDVNTASNISGREIIISDSGGEGDSIPVKSGEIKRINFELGAGNASLNFIELKTENTDYLIPVYISSSSQQAQSPSSTQQLVPSELILPIPTNTVTKQTVYLYNSGDAEIKNISLSLSDEISPFANLSQDYIDSIGPNDNAPIELSFFSAGETDVQGTLKANINGEQMLYTSISVNFLNNYTANATTQSYTSQTCAQLNGNICTGTDSCSAQTVYAKDNVCCLGTCSSSGSNSSSRIIIAVAIIVVIALGLFWFYKKKYSRAKKPVNLLDIAKGKN
jgi:hypothetical protein